MIERLGTNGDDVLDGSNDPEIFRPLLGRDLVQGEGGFDCLIVDYSGVTAPLVSSDVVNSVDGLAGFLKVADFANWVQFSGIDRLELALGGGADLFRFSTQAGLGSASLLIDGGLGEDTAVITASGLPSLRLTAGSTGSASSNIGLRFSNFERFSIDAGAGDYVIRTAGGNDSIRVGAGSSRIATGGGIDAIETSGGQAFIDGGAGADDIWRLTIAKAGPAVSLTRDGATGRISAGTSGTAVGVEWLRATFGDAADTVRLIDDRNSIIDTGGGNDRVSISGADGVYVRGGAGLDTLRFDWSDRAPAAVVISAGSDGTLGGSIGAYPGPSPTGFWFTFNAAATFDGFERVVCKLSGGDDTFSIRASDLAAGTVLKIDGGEGADRLAVGLGDTAGSLTVRGETLTVGASSFTGFETIELFGSLGIANDRLTGQSGTDILHGGYGRDVLTGGGGADRFVFDHAGEFGSVTVLRDFVPGTDRIGLTLSHFDALSGLASGATLPDSAFHAGAQAETAAQRMIYNAATGALFYDADGAGGETQVLFGVLANKAVLTADDFVAV